MIQDFDLSNFDEANWYYSSDKLQISAEHMFNSFKTSFDDGKSDGQAVSFFYSYILLLGYAIENYLKGASIEIYKLRNPNMKINSFNELKNKVWHLKKTGHELIHIFDIIGLQLYKAEEKLLQKFEEYIIWRGKYPAPISSSGANSELQSISESDLDILRQMKDRIKIEIKNERKQQVT